MKTQLISLEIKPTQVNPKAPVGGLDLTIRKADLIIIFFGFSKFYENQKVLETIVCNFVHLGSCEVPQKSWARSVLELSKQLKTNRQTDKQSKMGFPSPPPRSANIDVEIWFPPPPLGVQT